MLRFDLCSIHFSTSLLNFPPRPVTLQLLSIQNQRTEPAGALQHHITSIWEILKPPSLTSGPAGKSKRWVLPCVREGAAPTQSAWVPVMIYTHWTKQQGRHSHVSALTTLPSSAEGVLLQQGFECMTTHSACCYICKYSIPDKDVYFLRSF